MDCQVFEKRLESFLNGDLPPGDQRDCRRHLTGCPACRDLVTIAGGPVPGAEAQPPAELLASVLASTCGSTCAQARELLCGLADQTLVPGDRELLSLHLETCTGCRDTAAALRELAVDLPRLQELAPHSAFVDEVLAATLPAGVRWRRWWARTWPQWVRRPRFAWETAYICTLILTLVFVLSGSPLAAMSEAAQGLTRLNPTAELGNPLSRVEARVETATESLRQPLHFGIAGARRFGLEIVDQGREFLATSSTGLGTFWDRVTSQLERADDEASNESTDAP